MSRSYRKHPYLTDLQSAKDSRERKRKANRRVRSTKDVAHGGQFKKLSSSYDISDYSFYCPEELKARVK